MPLEPDEIERIGAREGWRAKTFGRGMQGQKPFFYVIEFWLDLACAVVGSIKPALHAITQRICGGVTFRFGTYHPELPLTLV